MKKKSCKSEEEIDKWLKNKEFEMYIIDTHLDQVSFPENPIIRDIV